MGIKDSKKKNKVLKIISITLCGLIVLFLLLLLTNYIVTHDNNRSNIENKNLNNTEIIKKNYIDGYKNIQEDGFFTFKMSEEDINQMLSNSMKEINDDRVSAIYYEKGEEDHHYFYADLKPHLFKTRVALDTVSYVDNVNKVVELQVIDAKLGKFPILNKIKNNGYLTNDFVSKVSEKANLPISFNDETNTFKVEPLKFVNYFETGELSKLLLNEVFSNKDNIRVSSLMNMRVDFSSLRSMKHKPSRTQGTLVNPLERVSSVITDGLIDSMSPGDSETTLALTSEEYSDYFKSELKDKKETYSSSLTSNTLEFYIKDIEAVLSVNQIKYMFNISINGYMVDASIFFDIKNSTYDGKLQTQLNTSKMYFGDIEKAVNDDIGVFIQGLLDEEMTSLASKYAFIEYASTNKLFTLNFSSIAKDYIGIDFYNRALKIDTINLDKFVFVVSL